jgi:hypothetical protein
LIYCDGYADIVFFNKLHIYPFRITNQPMKRRFQLRPFQFLFPISFKSIVIHYFILLRLKSKSRQIRTKQQQQSSSTSESRVVFRSHFLLNFILHWIEWKNHDSVHISEEDEVCCGFGIIVYNHGGAMAC